MKHANYKKIHENNAEMQAFWNKTIENEGRMHALRDKTIVKKAEMPRILRKDDRKSTLNARICS